jgi:hypothetical protein
MSMGVTIGIIVASIVLLLVLIGITIVCLKKRQRRKAAASSRLETDYDSRFGAIEISSPQAHGFMNSYSAQSHAVNDVDPVAPPYTADQYYDNLPKAHLAPPTLKDAKLGFTNETTAYPPPNIPVPVHRAYIPMRRPSTSSIESDHTSISSSATASASPTPNSGQRTPTTGQNQTRAGLLNKFFTRTPEQPAETPTTEPPLSSRTPKSTSPFPTPRSRASNSTSPLTTPNSGISQRSSIYKTLLPAPRAPREQLPQRAPYELAIRKPKVPVQLGLVPSLSTGGNTANTVDKREWSAASEVSEVEQWPGSM